MDNKKSEAFYSEAGPCGSIRRWTLGRKNLTTQCCNKHFWYQWWTLKHRRFRFFAEKSCGKEKVTERYAGCFVSLLWNQENTSKPMVQKSKKIIFLPPFLKKQVRRYWPRLPDGALIADYSGVRPKLSGPGGWTLGVVLNGEGWDPQNLNFHEGWSARWWFQISFIFNPGKIPILTPIFFNWVETTN